MPHLILLGDSILDNGAYVGRGPAVIDQVRNRLPSGWRASLLAIDGSTTADLAQQLAQLPADATHLVLSIGGNDALMQSTVLGEPAATIGAAMMRLQQVVTEFEANYRAALTQVTQHALPTLVCTIYYPRMPDPAMQQMYVAALCLFNDAIIRAVVDAGLPLLDLRRICVDDADYANPIEPSSTGGAKIAAGIATVITQHDAAVGKTTIYP